MSLIWIVAALLTGIAGIPVARQLRHHPRGLWLLFFTEMWERFSYYGMRSLLIFYLTEHFLLDDRAAQGRYSAYVALNYLMPLAGGLIGDRILGARRAVGFGALLLVAGHCTMAIESTPASSHIRYAGATYLVETQGRGEDRIRTLLTPHGKVSFAYARDGALLLSGDTRGLPRRIDAARFRTEVTPVAPWSQALFNLALALVVVGVGYQKANITALVGGLYVGRPDRDQGFTLYMFGINIGAFWSSVLCGWLGMEVGWWAGFGAAGLGMALGYVAFVRFGAVLGETGVPPVPAPRARWRIAAYLGAVPAVLAIAWLERDFLLTGAVLTACTAAIAAYLGWLAWRQGAAERRNLAVVVVLVVLGLIWTALAEQQGGPLSLFSERNTDLTVFGSRVDAAQVQAFYMGFLLVLVPVLAWLWDWLARWRRDPAPVLKFAAAFLLQALSFLLIGASGGFASAGGRISLSIVVVALLIHAASEMMMGPLILAEITRRAPARMTALLAAVWYLAVSWGQWLGGMVAQTASTDMLSARDSLPVYLRLFSAAGFGALGGCAAAVLVFWWMRAGGMLRASAPDSR